MTAPCVQSIPRHEIQEALDCIRGLQGVWFRPTNPATERFNCVAWALHDRSRFWWPGGHPGYFLEDDDKPCDYWPVRLTEPDPASNLDHFFRLFADHGFRACRDGALEHGVEKVVFYTQSCRGVELFQHAARQLPSGLWTSKLGRLIDLEHAAPQDLCEEYGETLTFLGRPLPTLLSAHS